MSILNPRFRHQATTLAGVLTLLMGTPDLGIAQRFVNPDSLRQLQSVVPLSGPPGTRVEISSENLPLAARIHLAVGAIHAGFETLAEGYQGEWPPDILMTPEIKSLVDSKWSDYQIKTQKP